MKRPALTARRSPIITVAGIVVPLGLALAQDPAITSQSAEEPDNTIVRVIVTGSNIPTAEEIGPHPVDSYRAHDITNLGVRSFTDFVQKMPPAMGASVNENVVNGGDGRTEINLRGILPKETLVLQDGRRLAPVGFAGDTVDLNTIPLGLVDHVDLLKDGASAIYGSDAVDGVVNIWLIHRFRGLELYASYGNTNLGFANDMGEERAYLLAGSGDDKTDIVIYAESHNRAAIYSRDADISHDADFTPFGGINFRSPNFSGDVQGFVYQPSLNGGSRVPTPHHAPGPATNDQYIPLRSNQLFNFADFTSAMGATDREYYYGSYERKICDRYLEFFADFKFARTFWTADLAPTPFTPDVFTDATHPSGISGAGISVPIQNPFNPFIVANYVSPGGFDPTLPATQTSAAPPGTQFTTGVRYRGFEGGPRTVKITTDNYEFTGGLKGNLEPVGDYFKTWEWESAFRYNEDNREELNGGIINNDALRSALLDTNPATAFNPFGLNRNTRAVIEKVFVTTHHDGRTSLTLADFKLNGDLFRVPAGPIAFAIGGEYRAEHADDGPDALVASGQTIGDTNFSRTKGSRSVWSAYWELRVPVTSPSWNIPGFHSLELGYQERYENFSDFGGAERPKIFVRWQPIDSSLTLRATYTEAFHAPTLSDLFRGQQQGIGFVNDPKSPATEPEVLTSISGNENLQPETAYEWTYGVIVTPGKWWSPLQGLTLHADFFHIDLRAVTVQLDAQFLVDHEDEFPGLVKRGASTGPLDPFGPIVLLLLPQENLGRFIEEGWDYEVAYSLETARFGHGDFGLLTARLNGTYVDRAVLQVVNGGREMVVVGQFGRSFFGTNASGSLTHNRWYASLFYNGPAGSWLGGIDTGFTVHYVGQYWDDPLSTPDLRGRKIREWVTLDWILNYTFNSPVAADANEVPGYAKQKEKGTETKAGKDKNVSPVSTADYKSCGWRAWLNNTTITLGINNVFDEPPPFVSASFENGYDETAANLKGRTWYLALKKRW